jgi:hypothetical protein
MIDLSLVLLVAIAQTPPGAPSSQPSSQPSSITAGSAEDVRADLALIVETSETDLSIQEGWTLIGPSDKQIPESDLKIEMPSGGRMLQIDEKARGFKRNENMTAIVATEPLIGTQQFTAAYLYPKAGSSLHLSRKMPYSISTGRLIVQDIAGMDVNISVQATRRTRELNGQNFAIYDFGQIARGTELRVTITGFPSQAVWPRRIAALLAVAIIGWMFWALSSKAVPGRKGATAISPVSARARRDQILKAIEVLERDLAAEKVKPKKYERRHAELMKELADVLHELELATGA